MNKTAIETAAKAIRQAYESGQPCSPVRHLLPELDVQSAYAVQQLNTEHWIQQGRRPVGCKAGLTSRSVQQQLGVDQPDFGMLYADMAVADGELIAVGDILQPKVEAEVALVLERDIDTEHPTVADLISAVAYALPAIEIVGSRIQDWDINIVDTIADNASSGLFVLGNEPKKLQQLDLRHCGMVMECRGEQVSVGAGLACLGHPLNAALWLAKTMATNGSPLRAGDIILTGALGPMVTVQPGDIIEARISGLGSVRAAFGQ
ncbi:2-keto-4-pentenoate hydratase [Sinobacterium caligoides]|uniref:2-keto-4-pentenoate hydratase n=1 Tax=Sinobacterium caligoides TaxID=933926 RepID=A0A3N2DPG1_9GAMM|nr:2-keto-4-pentenoate hydratase [Sinobacterium caligoides]ROS01687.1 2-keto-4-pentenoate hydratase [Sinobacterium caligoides]